MALVYKVVTDSMTPLIPVGAELNIEAIGPKDLKKFDIVVYEEASQLICHYVWHINKVYDQGSVTTKGLKNSEKDISFHFSKIKGRVTNFKIGLFLKCKIVLGLA